LLDKYKLHGKRSFTHSDKSRKASFELLKEPRWHYPKIFDRDFSRNGSGLNDYDKTFGARVQKPWAERRKRKVDVPTSALTSAAAAGAASRAAAAAAREEGLGLAVTF
jgi:hypothetical protein